MKQLLKKLKLKRLLSLMLVFSLIVTAAPAVYADDEETQANLIGAETVWSYLDNNTDPAGDSSEENYERTVWTNEEYDDSAWKTGKGSFGSKRGNEVYDVTHTANTVLDGCDGSNDTPAYFFRTTINISNLEKYTKLTGSVEYDDGVIVYVNGHRVAAGYDNACDENGTTLGHGFDANMQYGGSNGGPDILNINLLDMSILHEGANVVAVELHNGRKTSSDVWFDFKELSLSTEEVVYQNNVSLSVGADESQMNFTWYSPLNDASVSVSENEDLADCKTYEANSLLANDGQYSCKAVISGLEHNKTYYYRLNNKGKEGQIYLFSTGGKEKFSFALVGDPQIGAGNTEQDTIGWENTLNTMAASEEFYDISFLVSAGDQVNTASNEEQYDGYLEHNVLNGIPVMTSIGNHDSSSNAYNQHFNNANESDKYGVTAAGGDYYFVYNNTLFFMINSNAQSKEAVEGHKAFMQDALDATKDMNIKWKIAVFHHTLFTVASHAHDGYIDREDGFKNLIIPVLEEMDVDAVLTGHDHVYCRTYMMDGTEPVIQSDKYEYDNGTDAAPTAVNDPDGILYITANSGSGSKTYNILNESFPFSAVQNQENTANISKVTVSDKEFNITTYRTSDMSVIDTFTIRREAEIEPTYTPVVAGDIRVKGYYNETSSIELELIGRHNSGAMNADGGSLEIVQYNPVNGYAYAVSGVKGKLIAVNMESSYEGDRVVNLPGNEYDVKSLVEGFSYGDITSVAVSPDGKRLAVAIQAENYADNGVVALFECKDDGTLELLSTANTGVQPDMVTFADNNTILTADEGEPREGVNGTDPKGSVTIININSDNILEADSIYFDSFDEKRDELINSGVLIQKDTQPSVDFEPEYIAVSDNIAYVSLQEANAIAVLDIAKKKYTGVYPLGFQNYGEVRIDLQKNDTIEINTYENVYGIKMPDGISVANINGKTYILTANEGDSRADWTGLDNEYENVTSLNGSITLDKKVVWFNQEMWDGLDSNKSYIFGGRSFSIYEVTDKGLELVYDSGSDFEEITASKLPEYFNASNDKISIDNRSGKKGPEPESVVVGKVSERTYAYIALERIGGVVVYDITDPEHAEFVNYINSREFDAAIQGDVSPEGLCYVPALESKSGKAMLLAACEVSGTLAVYECNYNESNAPTPSPTVAPTAKPTAEPTVKPTSAPTVEPTAEPTVKPTSAPTAEPTVNPTTEPTSAPTTKPTVEPTTVPTAEPTVESEEFKEPAIVKVKVNGKKLTIKFKKVSGFTKYQIQYSTKKSFAKKYTKSVISKNTSVIFKKLKAKKTYYVRVRAYKKVDDKNEYSKWSRIKLVKIR